MLWTILIVYHNAPHCQVGLQYFCFFHFHQHKLSELLRPLGRSNSLSDHPSETSLDNYNKFDIICRIVDTNATIEETTAGITTVLERGLYHE